MIERAGNSLYAVDLAIPAGAAKGDPGSRLRGKRRERQDAQFRRSLRRQPFRETEARPAIQIEIERGGIGCITFGNPWAPSWKPPADVAAISDPICAEPRNHV